MKDDPLSVSQRRGLRWLLEKYLDVASGFDAVWAIGPFPKQRPGRAVLLCANHVGWWDGFLLWKAQRAFFHGKNIYTIMLQRELEKRQWFTKLGAIGIDPASTTSLRQALKTVRELRSVSDCLLTYFPQGALYPSTKRPLGFMRGVELFAEAMAPADVLPVGIHVEPMHARLPTAFLVFGELIPADGQDNLAAIYEERVEDTLDKFLALLQQHGEKIFEAIPANERQRLR